MPSDALIARALATASLGGGFEVDELVRRGTQVLGRRWRWLPSLARRVCEAFGNRPWASHTEVARFILHDPGFLRACGRHDLELVYSTTMPPIMRPMPAARSWAVPAIASSGALAEWLGLTIGELEWFADLQTLEYKRNQGRLRHYHYRVLAKRFGVRLIEAPKPRLKEIQRHILSDILDHILLHAAVHGFRRGHSIQTFAAPHVGKQVVLRIDLDNFFPSIRAARIRALLRAVGYPEAVANLLAGLCTNAAPQDVWDQEFCGDSRSLRLARWRYSQPHLPQGAPTSPALANLCAYRLDCRLTGLAQSAGATYTRYADDLAFSGDADFARVVHRFRIHACATLLEEGFAAHHHKTRVMRHGVQQRLAGLIVNERLNVARPDFDRLKATLVNCIRFGPQSQNRAGHDDFRARLNGQVSFVEAVNPSKGSKLRELFNKVQWP